MAYAAAAAAATVGVATYLATRAPPETPDVKAPDAGVSPTPSAEPRVDAKKIRAAALAACARGAFQECLAGLDAAQATDPAGDETSEVRAARRRATEGMAAEEKKAGKGGK